MSGKRIIVKIDCIGNPVVEAEGFIGDSCVSATKPIEEALSGGAANVVHEKPEMHQPNTDELSDTENMYI